MNQRKRRIREYLSIHIVKHPSRVVLLAIILINLLFICLAAFVLSQISPAVMQGRGFWAAIFYTLTMIMDAGCITFIVEDVGAANAAVVVACLVTILVGMVFFTGGIIGYMSNRIANFIENANAGGRRIHASDHIVILNWNNRASEIVNDLLYSERRETVIVLVENDRDDVRSEIENRLSETIAQEAREMAQICSALPKQKRRKYRRDHRLRKPTVIVRQGDTFSHKQLADISLDRARSVILLSNAASEAEQNTSGQKGNPSTVKTLVLVAEMTSAENSADNQKIIVEVEDPWTEDLVNKIIAHKEKLGKCNIVPLPINRILGQLLSQFSIMPDLNLVYSDLFSNKGAEFYSVPDDASKRASADDANLYGYLLDHCSAVPLTIADTKVGKHFFFMADLEQELHLVSEMEPERFSPASLNPKYWQPRRNVLILGHNSNISALMDGFDSYRNEWNPAADGRDILNVHVLDDPESLAKMDQYRQYSYVTRVIGADLYDQKTIYETINAFIDQQDGDTGILILSDNLVPDESIDASALTYLIYVQDVLSQRRAANGGKDTERIDVVVEILNPKNYDVVLSYNVNNVVISNRYISKMITQICSKEALYEFYSDILTYDSAGAQAYVSKELYVKRAGDYFRKLPPPCTAGDLIRSIYLGSEQLGDDCTAITLGYITEHGEMIIFTGDQFLIPVELKENDKLILFGSH